MPHDEITLDGACGIASVTTNCAARRTLTSRAVTFTPTVNESCNVKLVLADGETIDGKLSFQSNSCSWQSEWNGQQSYGFFSVGTCRPDAGTDAGLGGD